MGRLLTPSQKVLVRNQTITEFFKPVLNQADRGNIKDAGIGLSVLRAERFEKKVSSPKKVRRKKMPDQTPSTSPVLDAFRRGIKEKKDSVNILENGKVCKALDSLYPKVVMQKLLITAGSHSCFLARKDKTVKSEQGRNEKCLGVTRAPLSCGNSWEQKTDCMDLEGTSSDSDKWVSSSEADTRKACARNNGTVNTTPLCQNPGLPMKLSCAPTGSELRLSLEALRRERKRKKHRTKPSKAHPGKPFSGTNDPSQPQPKQVSKEEASSPNALRTSSEMAAEGCVDSCHMSSQLSDKLKVESTCIDQSKLNRKAKSSFDSEDDGLECSLNTAADDDEEVFLPLQEILSSSPKPQAGALEEPCLDSFSQDTMTPLLKLHLSKPPVVSQVSYVNSLEHLLKEKEESKRVDELEKLLQEDIQGREMDSSDGDDEENAGGDEDLSEEHRAFIKRFSVIAHAIPDYHPGEDIFDLSTSGMIFNIHNLDLRNFHFTPQNPIEKLLLSSGVTQQLSLTINGFLSSAYSCILCPIPILKWLFQMMSVHPDYCVSTQILDRLMEITLKNASISDEQSKPWIPSLADVSAVFVNMGVAFRSLFPLQHLQPNFNECDILSQRQETVSKQQPRGDSTSTSPAFSSLPENNLINVIKFLGFCTTVIQGGYTDQEILLLLLLLFKISLEKLLKQIPLVDFQCLFVKLLISIEDWDTKMPELCLAVSELSSHHHNLLWLVQLVPSWIIRGREVRRRLSLVIISKLLNKKHIEIPDESDKQMSLLHQFLVYMKPANLLKEMRKGLEQQNADGDHIHTEVEQEAYYLIYILLHLVSEASFFDVVNSNQRQHLLKLCGALDKHIKCGIREDARLFYRTKVKDLVARIYGKWQDMIQTTRPTQGQLHDFWEPD
nr:PREDICTED: protein FAM178A [Phalacrocorax carbo]